jgi:hypothetical protein
MLKTHAKVYLDHLKALEQVHSKMKESFKLFGISNAALVHKQAKNSHTNAYIKRSSIILPNGKRKTPKEVCIAALLAKFNPPPKKKTKKNLSTVVNIDEKVQQVYQ